MAVETIYASFSSKKALLRAAMDVAIVGDTQPVPLMAREEVQRLRDLPMEDRDTCAWSAAGRVAGQGGRLTRRIPSPRIAEVQIVCWRFGLIYGITAPGFDLRLLASEWAAVFLAAGKKSSTRACTSLTVSNLGSHHSLFRQAGSASVPKVIHFVS